MIKVKVLGGEFSEQNKFIETFEGLLAGFNNGYAVVIHPSGSFLIIPLWMLQYIPEPIHIPNITYHKEESAVEFVKKEEIKDQFVGEVAKETLAEKPKKKYIWKK